MPRIFLSELSRTRYFDSIKQKSNLSWIAIANKLKVSGRQLRDWRRGKYSLPRLLTSKIREEFGVKLPEGFLQKEDWWNNKIVGSTGAKKRNKIYGNPGTLEGRLKGGVASIKTHKRLKTIYFLPRKIHRPYLNVKLAELTGVLLGDGSLSKWQVRIYLNINTDKCYSLYLKKLIDQLFGVNTSIIEEVNESTIDLVVSRSKVVRFLQSRGLLLGDKIKQGLDIPVWVLKRRSWKIACLRGLFDTDGCTYVDHHSYNGKQYGHLGIVFTSYSPRLVTNVTKILVGLGYHPTLASRNRVFLRKEKEVLRFFEEFRPSNVRHALVLKKFLEGYRSGYNGIASKAIVAAR